MVAAVNEEVLNTSSSPTFTYTYTSFISLHTTRRAYPRPPLFLAFFYEILVTLKNSFLGILTPAKHVVVVCFSDPSGGRLLNHARENSCSLKNGE